MAYVLGSENIFPPLPTQAQLIAEAIVKVDKITSEKILDGFDYAVNGEVYHFSYDMADQQNFAEKNAAAVLDVSMSGMDEAAKAEILKKLMEAMGGGSSGATAVAWPCTWQGWKDGVSHSLQFTSIEYIALGIAAGTHKTNCLGEGWKIKEDIRATQTEAELKAVLKQYDIEEQYRLACEASQ